MKGFILLLVFVTYVDLVIALSNIKSKRRSQGLVFRSTFESSEVCISLGCGSGKGYVGTKGGDCFSVKRCNKCSTTQYFSSAFSYCSTIPSLNSELTIFYGSLNSLTSFEVSNFESETSEEIGDEGKEVSDIDESDDDDDDDDDDDNDDNHKEDMLSEQITKGKNERVAKKMSISSSEVFSSSSFLQLYSQVSESSEIDDANSDIGRNKGKENDNKKYSKRIKGIFSRMFSKKNKDKQNDDLNGFSQAESTVKKNLTLKKLFKKKNKVTAKKKYEGISSKLKQVFVRKNELVEFNLKGDEIYKRIPLCPVSFKLIFF
ncbi:hypothetical protein FG379_000702 [Cryptosporidium bovis]|uniref:uncharacterized protein n=1 Tax=Cryptosporidium bovis TaxID=310047 RepID=UPI00351A3C10|nr:hypothetical protein FG379_000702 [Cryptosporidium bovis]